MFMEHVSNLSIEEKFKPSCHSRPLARLSESALFCSWIFTVHVSTLEVRDSRAPLSNADWFPIRGAITTNSDILDHVAESLVHFYKARSHCAYDPE